MNPTWTLSVVRRSERSRTSDTSTPGAKNPVQVTVIRWVRLHVGVGDVMSKLVAFQLLQPALELDQPMRLVCQEGHMAQLIPDLANHKLDVVLSDPM